MGARLSGLWFTSMLAAVSVAAQGDIRTAHDASRLKIAYETLVEDYGRGQRVSVLRELSSWSEAALERAVQEARGERDARFRALEILLRLDAALTHAGSEGIEGFARRIERLEALDRDGLDPGVRRNWRLAAAAAFLQSYHSERARKQAERALDVAKDDPLLLVVLGATFEQQATGVARPTSTMGVVDDPRFIENYRRSHARDLYERALRLDPELAEARLRLARNLAEDGDHEASREHALWVLSHAQLPDMRYVAFLLLGRDLERRGSLDEAVSLYREAAAVDPRGGVAPFAASHAARRDGEAEVARDALLRALAARDSGDYVDAWQSYYQGRPAWLQGAIASIQEWLASSW